MNSSALCEWPLSREWTQIKIIHLSHPGDTAYPGALPETRTTCFITTSLFQLNGVTFKHFGSVRQGLNFHSTSICNKSWAEFFTEDKKTEPVPTRSS